MLIYLARPQVGPFIWVERRGPIPKFVTLQIISQGASHTLIRPLRLPFNGRELGDECNPSKGPMVTKALMWLNTSFPLTSWAETETQSDLTGHGPNTKISFK